MHLPLPVLTKKVSSVRLQRGRLLDKGPKKGPWIGGGGAQKIKGFLSVQILCLLTNFSQKNAQPPFLVKSAKNLRFWAAKTGASHRAKIWPN